MLDAQRAGAEPGPYHATNVALHAAAVIVLYQVLLAFGSARQAALLAALLFAVHPLNAQAVAWIAGRNELLYGLFTLGALWAYLQFVASGRALWLGLHTVCFALALFSKETAVALTPGVLLHWVVFRHRDRRRLVSLVTAHAIVLFMWVALRASALSGPSTDTAAVADAIRQSWQFLSYLGKAVLPVDLNVMPGRSVLGMSLGICACAALLAAARLVSPRIAAFAAGWIVLFLVPGLLVPQLPAYEHRAYVPLAGAAILVASLLSPDQRTLSRRIAIVAIALLAARTFQHTAVFHDPESYWRNGTKSPAFAPIAHVNLGQLREQAGDLTEAQAQYRRAIALDPQTPKARNNLGVVLMQLGRSSEAVALFRDETTRHPQNPDAWFNLGLWAEMQGDLEEAARHYRRALAADPGYAPAAEKLKFIAGALREP